MKPRLTTWILALSFVSIAFIGIANAKGPFTIEVNDLSTRQSIPIDSVTNKPYPNYKWYSLQLKQGEIKYVSVRATFSLRRENPGDYGQIYFINTSNPIPQAIEGWKDIGLYRRLYEDKEYIYENLLIIKAENCQPGIYDYKIMGGYSESKIWKTGGDETGVTIQIKIQKLDTARYARPVLCAPDAFTPGTSNTLFWRPSRMPNVEFQDVYCFDSADSLNFKKSLRHVYKVNGDSIPVVFDGLLNGHRYGYFAKTVYRDGVALYSNFEYSTQDSIPPEGVSESLYMQYDGNGRIQMGWKNVTDPKPPYGVESGIRHYIIYQAMNNEEEKIFSTVPYVPGDAYVNFETTISPDAIPKYFRVRAVDWAGNEGDGDRTTNMPVDAIIPIENFQPNDDPGHGAGSLQYCKSDTLRLSYTLQREQGDIRLIQFQAVREDESFFDQSPSHGGRFFESPWLATAPGVTSRAEFLLTQSGQETLPKQFINGHTYIWRVRGKSNATAKIADLPMNGLDNRWRVDCFPPEDIRNLKVESIITDTIFAHWKFRVAWEKATDGGSGIKTYHVQRFIGAVLDTTFLERSLVFNDDAGNALQGLSNGLVSYRVLAEDSAGWVRDTTAWMAGDRALNGPDVKFDAGDSNGYFLKNNSTLIFNRTTVRVRVSYADTSTMRSNNEYKIWINGVESVVEADLTNTLDLPIPQEQVKTGLKVFNIKIRTLYEAHRSSVWSDKIRAVFHSLEAVKSLTVVNISSYYKGDIHLKWPTPVYTVSGKTLPILDISHYIVERRADDQTAWDSVASVPPAPNIVQWSDVFDRGNMIANRKYHYRVVKVNLLREKSDPSNTGWAYCNRPPMIDSTAKIVYNANSDNYNITIRWDRANPNAVQRGFTTYIKAYRNILGKIRPLDPSMVSNDKQEYTLFNAGPDSNYIFQVMEIPNIAADTVGWHFAWSMPRTIRFIKLSASIQPQPKGPISLRWDCKLVDTLLVDSTHKDQKRNGDLEKKKKYFINIVRTMVGDTDRIVRSFVNRVNNAADTAHYMYYTDTIPASGIMHHFKYRIHALDTLDQVVAAFTADSVLSDPGSVYIPFIDRDTLAVAAGFFKDSIETLKVGFYWKDALGRRVKESTRGAESCKVEASTSACFSPFPNQTSTTGWFSADYKKPFCEIRLPEWADRQNTDLYFRITAKDSLGNNLSPGGYWSTTVDSTCKYLGDFEEAPSILFDDKNPLAVPVDSTDVTTVAHPTTADSIDRTITWGWKSGEIQPGITDRSEILLKNIYAYKVIRISGGSVAGKSDTVCTRKVGAPYLCIDQTSNRNDNYQIIVIDRAGNVTRGNSVDPHFVETPAAPDSLGPAYQDRQGCTVSSNPGDSLLIEMAMLRRNFADAHRIGEMTPPGSEILSRSGWTAALTYLDTTGWGETDADSVFFRVKSKKAFEVTSHGKPIVRWIESGWSEIGAWTNPAKPGRPVGKPGQTDPSALPREFGMDQNYPNPFNAGTQIAFRLAEAADVNLVLFNIQGECTATLATAKMPAGFHSVQWNGTSDRGGAAASGLYFAVLTAKTETGTMLQKRIKLVMIR
jgi:hypothetical protein